MDQRLFTLAGQRLERLTRNETPDLARAIVAFIRGQASVERAVLCDVPYIRFTGNGIDVLVRNDDWVKVIPYIKEGSFDPSVVPVSHAVVFHPEQRVDGSVVDVTDRELYERILNVLNTLFTVEFPTG